MRRDFERVLMICDEARVGACSLWIKQFVVKSLVFEADEGKKKQFDRSASVFMYGERGLDRQSSGSVVEGYGERGRGIKVEWQG